MTDATTAARLPQRLARHRPKRLASGFTLIELLVVVAILGLLLALVIVGFGRAKTLARVTSCLSQQRQLALAQVGYAADNNGAYASNRTGPDGNFSYTLSAGGQSWPILINNGNTNAASYHTWTASYGTSVQAGQELQYGLNSENTNAKALSGGRLYPYIGSNNVYKSPLDPTNRIRSYSFTGFVGGTVPEDSNEWANKWVAWFVSQGVTPREWRTTHVVHHKVPSQTLMTLTEDDSDGFAYNNQGWVIDPRPPLGSPVPQGAPNPSTWAATGGWDGWIDWPAFWDPRNLTYSYADGSTESYSLQKPSLVSLIEGPPGAGFGHRWAQPGDQIGQPWRRDWMHFRERLLPGVIPPMTTPYPGNPAP